MSHSSQTSSRRRPGMLKGLRQLRLEFEPDTLGEDIAAAEDVDAEQLMISGERGFSFFEDESYHSTRPSLNANSRSGRCPGSDGGSATDASGVRTLGLEKSVRDNEEFITHQDEWNGCGLELRVWAGPVQPHKNPIINEYRQLVLNYGSLRDGVGPASPCQVHAGVPERSLIFHTAWRTAIMPPGELVPPALEDVAGMGDVLAALKRHRATARFQYDNLKRERRDVALSAPLGAPHFFWTGNLEVSTKQ
ncbi:hypothetical protein ISF_09238 [Cordyceps fumosorosea ARSEF 2679]|uniref:Uncharacterized protein n=1 Tax=Cordyceps fumosorosea (strain ARSEF 2679) TaxID=1081104 RepID=A0A162I6B0_CORFA|nr:hypothetical protein ISF_09238 [Cordyceps fumosorosea ARSEF 2679]OAA52855.1 hypothetical protein ISF_09238 [Cordyceps fumosorosea ARSEF 2679]